jgi:hypothetical protein
VNIGISNILSSPGENEHVALFYNDAEEMRSYIAAYLNEGLKRGELCIFATVHYREEGYIEKLAPLIDDFKENMEKGNLLVVDLAPHYISAMLEDLDPFEKSKEQIIEKAKARPEKHIRFTGDCVGLLFKNRHFDECVMIEQWWQKKPHGSVLCLYPKQFLDAHPYDAERAVVATHDRLLGEKPDEGIAAVSESAEAEEEK